MGQTGHKKTNITMCILSGIAMLQVVCGHLDFDVLSLGGLFPYYSFHVMVFVFVSGYFYNPQKEDHILSFIAHKARRLLLPYYIINFIFGIVSSILSSEGFTYATTMNIKNYLLEPFLGGHQYGLNFPAWFVPALFVIELVNICFRKLFSLFRIKSEWVFFIVTLIFGIICVYLAQNGHVWGWYKTPGRIIFMLPVYEFGRLYRDKLEKYETQINNGVFFSVLILLQLIILLISDGAVNFSAVWCTGFAGSCVLPYLTTATGTLFWLRISRIIANAGGCRALERIGNDTFMIMMLHVAAAFLINLFTLFICRRINPALAFDMEEFKSNVNYVYLVRGLYPWKLVYVIGSIGLSCLIASWTEKLRLCIQNIYSSRLASKSGQ